VAPAQVSINIGPAPVCPYGYFDYAPYDCAPYGFYGPARGSMVLMASTATSITAGIHVMVTTDRRLSVGPSPSSTSTRTKPTMHKATSAIPVMMEAMSTAPDFQAVVTPVVVTDREFPELSGRPAS